MKLSVTIIDSRPAPGHSYNSGAKPEEFERVSATEVEAGSRVIAGILRSIAEDLDPTPEPGIASIGDDQW